MAEGHNSHCPMQGGESRCQDPLRPPAALSGSDRGAGHGGLRPVFRGGCCLSAAPAAALARSVLIHVVALRWLSAAGDTYPAKHEGRRSQPSVQLTISAETIDATGTHGWDVAARRRWGRTLGADMPRPPRGRRGSFRRDNTPRRSHGIRRRTRGSSWCATAPRLLAPCFPRIFDPVAAESKCSRRTLQKAW